ncbi:DUF4397 domain-containing protein [Haloferacaceae archaeon DSL9]
MRESPRREVLKAAGGLAFIGALAGCSGDAQDDGAQEEEDNQSGQEEDQPGQEDGQEEEQPEDEGEEPAQDEEEDQQGETGPANFRLAHMAPGYPGVDVYIDDEPAIDELEFGDVTDYVSLESGSYNVRVTVSGAPALTVFDESVDVASGDQTAVALQPQAEASDGGAAGNETAEGGNETEEGGNETAEGGAGTGGMGGQLTVEIFEDQNEAPDESLNNSRIRLIHASPDAPNVNVGVGNSIIFENVGYGEGEYMDIQAGEYTFDVYPADGGSGGAPLLDGGVIASKVAAWVQEDEEEEQPEDGNETAEDGNETAEGEEQPGEEEQPDEETEEEPIASFGVELAENSVYTVFATGYLDPEQFDSDIEFDAIVTQDVIDGELATEDDE